MFKQLFKRSNSIRQYYTVSTSRLEKTKQESYKELTKLLQSQIKLNGPITVAEYMKQVLISPSAGYYMHKDVFGQSGDFVTSPELGQLFGEMIGVWFLNEWKKIGSPKPFQIVELGPGKGSLCHDVLKVFKHFNELNECSVSLVEVSPFLRDMQAKNLCLTSGPVKSSEDDLAQFRGTTTSGMKISWYEHLKEVPAQFSLYLAHEFFDALPIHKYQKTENGFKEILIDVDEQNNFKYVLSTKELPPSVKLLLNDEDLKGLENVEFSLESILLVEHLADRINEDGGIALIADYGKYGQPGDSFRGFKKHKLHDPLVEPGSADLTADVDFNLLKRVAMEKDRCIGFGPVPQGEFLTRMGMSHRLQQLLENATPEEKKSLQFAHDMMTDPKQMGERFKLLSLFPEVLKNHLQKFPVTGFS